MDATSPQKIDKNSEELETIAPETREVEKIPEELTALPPAEQDEPPAAPVKAKAKGRPKGAKDAKPRAKKPAKAVVLAEAPVTEAAQEEEEPPLPRAVPGSRPIPTEATDSREALMLKLLSQQARSRQNRKVAVWKSWFS